jgi:signal transduction histidine kinase
MTKILVVDDREDNLMSIESILEKDNYEITKVSSGRKALKVLLSEFDFALILMDVKMPEMNGFETASLIYERQKLKNIPIIFITAHDYNEENIFKGYQVGAVDYIYKPINPEYLRAKVKVFIELYSKNQQLVSQEQKMMKITKNLETEIAERKMSEEKVQGLNIQLLQYIDKLENANKELDRFAFMASHDLQEPLRKIRTFADRLNTNYASNLDADGIKYLKRIEYSAEKMQNLIQDILTFSKITNALDNYDEVDLNSLLTEILNEVNMETPNGSIKIIKGKLPTIYSNRLLMSTLFQNLLNNAIKYRRVDVEHEIKIYSEFEEKAPDNKYYRIFVEDNGIGFDQKYSDQIFKMFTRLHQTNTEGNGIGLALCKKIVETHQGFISVRSKENEGTTFIISLPFQAQNTNGNSKISSGSLKN